MPSRLTQRFATYASVGTGTLCIFFGVNAFLNPASALSFFNFSLPSSRQEYQLVTSLLAVYGVRGVLFMGVATYATAYCGTSKAQGWVALATAAVAAVDGG